MTSVTVEPEADDTTFPWTDMTPGDFQSNVGVGSSNTISGTLKFIEGGLSPSGPLSGDGHFLALKFSDVDPDATSVKVGLRPTYRTGERVDDDSGLVELLGDPDMNGVFKVNDTSQTFKIVSTDGTYTNTQVFDLSGLTLES